MKLPISTVHCPQVKFTHAVICPATDLDDEVKGGFWIAASLPGHPRLQHLQKTRHDAHHDPLTSFPDYEGPVMHPAYWKAK